MAGAALLLLCSCDDFLTTTPKDAMSPNGTWQTEDDVNKFLNGCYDGWESTYTMSYWDCASDFGYGNFSWEGWKSLANGTVSATSEDNSAWSKALFYNYTYVRRVNTLLANIDKATFSSDAVKNDIMGQARFIRDWQYYRMVMCYGGVPIVYNFATADEAKVPRNSADSVRKYIMDDLNEIIPMLNTTPSARGHVAKGAAMALKMRLALYESDWATAKEAAQNIIDLGLYSLETEYATLFSNAGKDSKEIILACQQIANTYSLDMSYYFPNSSGGWSSTVPTQQCVDNYEMANGMTISETGSGYDATHPYHARDPRLYATVIYPGCDYNGKVYNSMDKTLEDGSNNPDFHSNADNATKTGYNWRKYADPLSQYASIENTDANAIIFRYAEVLLTWAEAENELNGPSAQVYAYINQVRSRAGMPDVDQTKYATKETLRELIHRERGSEFAGEGIRRWDILRWTTSDGQALANTVLNTQIRRINGTLTGSTTKDSSDPTMRVTITPGTTDFIESRTFDSHNAVFPIPQSALDKNPQLKQNPQY